MDTSASISLSRAFGHCAHTSSYWTWIVIAIVFIIGVIYGLVQYSKKNEVNPYVKTVLIFLCAAALMMAIFLRPCDVAANTSEAMANANQWLGY